MKAMKHGGRREGAGRKTPAGPRVARTYKIDADLVAWIAEEAVETKMTVSDVVNLSLRGLQTMKAYQKKIFLKGIDISD